jgi:hypothetical protein
MTYSLEVQPAGTSASGRNATIVASDTAAPRPRRIIGLVIASG